MSRVTRNSGKGYRHHRRSRPQHQIDLFGSGLSKDATGAPAWPELPAEVRAALTSLMTRLILDHAATTAGGNRETGQLSRSGNGAAFSVGTRDNTLSRLNGWPMRSPADASLQYSRIATHGAGRRGSLVLRRIGLSPITPRQSPGAPTVVATQSGLGQHEPQNSNPACCVDEKDSRRTRRPAHLRQGSIPLRGRCHKPPLEGVDDEDAEGNHQPNNHVEQQEP